MPVLIRRCPNPKCRKTGAGLRKTRTPLYLCGKCRHEFDEPIIEYESRTVYTAIFGAEWCTVDGPVSADALKSVLMVADTQSAIRKADPDKLADLLGEVAADDAALLDETPAADLDSANPIAGGRRRRMVTVRNNQGQFRRAVIRRDGLVCAITGPAPSSALHAAHLRAFAVHESHNPNEGLMLRTDIHGLFDAGLLAVDPDTMEIVASPELVAYPHYWSLRGTRIESGPWRAALADHFAEVSQGWPCSNAEEARNRGTRSTTVEAGREPRSEGDPL
ncbi:HNH endonuclease [Nocardia sp. NPDC057663]|uniref:HNH endonuclease n=1 Tax=Nocardia sp. NPDC057663 TaxID=3346201 RepID=UPI00366E5BDE